MLELSQSLEDDSEAFVYFVEVKYFNKIKYRNIMKNLYFIL